MPFQVGSIQTQVLDHKHIGLWAYCAGPASGKGFLKLLWIVTATVVVIASCQ